MGRRNAMNPKNKATTKSDPFTTKFEDIIKGLENFFENAKKMTGPSVTQFSFSSLAIPQKELKKLAELGKEYKDYSTSSLEQLERTFGKCLHPDTNASRALYFSSALSAICLIADTYLSLAKKYRETNSYAEMLAAEEQAIEFFKQYFELYQRLSKDKLFLLWSNTDDLLFNPSLPDPKDMQFAENYHRFANSDPLFIAWKKAVARQSGSSDKKPAQDAKLWQQFNDWKMNEYTHWSSYLKEVAHGTALENLLDVYSVAIKHCAAKEFEFSEIDEDEIWDSPEFSGIQNPKKARDFCIDAASCCGQAMNLPYSKGHHAVQIQKTLKEKSGKFTRIGARLQIEFPELSSQPYKLK